MGIETASKAESAATVSVSPAVTWQRILSFAPAATFVCAAFLFLLGAAMQKGLDHDEHMYVAGGALLAKGLDPYRDFPYLQMPGLSLVYALLFQFTGDLLFSARVLSVVCATLTIALLFLAAFDLFRAYPYLVRFLIGVAAALLLVANPVFIYASGLAWNHDLPVFLCVLAFVLLLRGVGAQRPGWWLFFSGLALGFAICTRLSFAPAVVPFAVGTFIMNRGDGEARRQSNKRSSLPLASEVSFLIGLVIALLPALLMFAFSPARFMFGNLGYHQVNELYRQQTGYTLAMTLGGKLSYLWDVIREPGTLPLYLALAFFMLVALAVGVRYRFAGWAGLAMALAVLASLVVGLLLPTPTWYQYFYALIPFVILSALYALASLARLGRWQWAALALFGLAVLICAYNGLSGYSHLDSSLSSGSWVTTRVRQVGQEMRAGVGEGKALTLSPLYPLEGGLDIYPQFASGPFAWRVAPLMSAQERRAAGIVGPDDLDSFLQAQPPKAIAVGQESDLEGPLVKYAQRHGYKAQKLSNGMTLWISP